MSPRDEVDGLQAQVSQVLLDSTVLPWDQLREVTPRLAVSTIKSVLHLEFLHLPGYYYYDQGVMGKQNDVLEKDKTANEEG